MSNNISASTAANAVSAAVAASFPRASVPYSLLQGIQLRPLAPATAPHFASSELWKDQATLVHVVRRPGCTFCREEARLLEARRSEIEAAGVRMVAVVKEELGADIFAETYTKSPVFLDADLGFYRALGGGDLKRAGPVSMLLSPSFWANWVRNKGAGVSGNLEGEGWVKGGVVVLRPGEGGAVYVFQEATIGQAWPMEEVVAACKVASA